MRRQTLVYCNECPAGSWGVHALNRNKWLNDFACTVACSNTPDWIRSHHTGEKDWFSPLSSWLLSNVLRRTQWRLGFDTSPLREARRYVCGHHFMVGEGARPLKQDYCIASDSHFNKGKLSQWVLAVCVSWSHSMHSLACHVCLYSVRSQSLESVGSHAHK